MILTEVAEGHGSAMSVGSFDSSKWKGTPVLDSGPRHDSMAQHRVTDCGIPILGEARELIAGPRFWHGGPPSGRYPTTSRCLKYWW